MMQQTSDAPKLRIGELATEFRLNPKTIRYYEQIGLLPTPRRTPSGYRLYGDADRQRLWFVGKAKAIGLTLEEIREILELRRDGVQPCEHVLAMLDRKLAAVDEQLRALEDFRQELLTLREEAVETISSDATICRIIEHHQNTR